MENRVQDYAEDRERLLLDLRRKGLRAWVPAELVRDAILHCGWRIERMPGMEPGVLSLSYPEQQVVKLPRDFRQRLRVPETARAVMNETLACQLARHYAFVRPA